MRAAGSYSYSLNRLGTLLTYKCTRIGQQKLQYHVDFSLQVINCPLFGRFLGFLQLHLWKGTVNLHIKKHLSSIYIDPHVNKTMHLYILTLVFIYGRR